MEACPVTVPMCLQIAVRYSASETCDLAKECLHRILELQPGWSTNHPLRASTHGKLTACLGEWRSIG
jgi:hypothetical protein